MRDSIRLPFCIVQPLCNNHFSHALGNNSLRSQRGIKKSELPGPENIASLRTRKKICPLEISIGEFRAERHKGVINVSITRLLTPEQISFTEFSCPHLNPLITHFTAKRRSEYLSFSDHCEHLSVASKNCKAGANESGPESSNP